VVLWLRVRDFVECSIKLVFAEELSFASYVLASSDAFGKKGRYKCFHGNIVSGVAISAVLLYKSSGTAMLLLMFPLALLSSKTPECHHPNAKVVRAGEIWRKIA
jgi:hypothetical protein